MNPVSAPQEPVAWMIKFTADGVPGTNFCGHNPIGDYRMLDPEATSTPLYAVAAVPAQSLSAQILERASNLVVAIPHGDNCFLHNDGGEFDKCFCGKDSLLHAIEGLAESAASLAPVGWKSAPLEATKAMTDAAMATPGMQAINGILALHQARTGSIDRFPGEGSALEQAWRAMIAAAPKERP